MPNRGSRHETALEIRHSRSLYASGRISGIRHVHLNLYGLGLRLISYCHRLFAVCASWGWMSASRKLRICQSPSAPGPFATVLRMSPFRPER